MSRYCGAVMRDQWLDEVLEKCLYISLLFDSKRLHESIYKASELLAWFEFKLNFLCIILREKNKE